MKAINKIKLVIVGMIIIGLAVLCPFASQAKFNSLVPENSFDAPRGFPVRAVRNSAFATW
jgi:hypothetical protein